MKTLTELLQLIHLFVNVVLIQSLQNTSLHCTRFQEARNKLQDILDGISDSTARKKRLQLSEALLLAPKSDLVTRKQNYWIKEALFEFIANTQVRL